MLFGDLTRTTRALQLDRTRAAEIDQFVSILTATVTFLETTAIVYAKTLLPSTSVSGS